MISEFHESLPRCDVMNRNLGIALDTKKVITLSGPRRCGKSFYIFQLINELFNQERGNQSIYINFGDARLDFSSAPMQLILEAYYELYPENRDKDLYLFFDDIHVVNDWEKIVLRLYDTVSKNIIVTSTSTKLLENTTSFRGRCQGYHLFPLSFVEFCKFQDITLSDVDSARDKSLVKAQFEEYIKFGGYPETIFMDKEFTQKTLQSYFDLMVFRDVVTRHKVSNVPILTQFLKSMLSHIAETLSVRQVYNELKKQDSLLSKYAIEDYFNYGLDCFLLFMLIPYEPSDVNQPENTKKFYAVDTGLVNALTLRFIQDWGKLLENIVFLQLLREEKAVYYLKDEFECDFIVKKNASITEAVQVCPSLRALPTRQREIRGLMQALDRFNLSEGTILTLDEEEELVVHDKKLWFDPAGNGW
ncbi:MAG: ATP-binding protein [bacterium]